MANTTSLTPQTVIASSFTGDYRIDVLLPGFDIKWEPDVPAGTARKLTYSFALTPNYLTDLEGAAANTASFTPLTTLQKTAVKKILAAVSERLMITFTEVTETTASDTPVGQIRFANNKQIGSAGYAFQPWGDDATDGDVFLNVANMSSSFDVGSAMYETAFHVLGHALGLKHPGNDNAGEVTTKDSGNHLASSEDSPQVSLMSNVEHPQGLQRVDFGPYDLLALDHLYGLRPVRTGNDTYKYTDSAGWQLQTLIDSGGVDTLDLSAITSPTTVDLRGGSSSSIGWLPSRKAAALNSLQLAFGTQIENLVGGPQNDAITGNTADNMIDGGAGNDVYSFSGELSEYQIEFDRSAQRFKVSDSASERDGTDSLARIETMKFSDKSLTVASASHESYADVPEDLYQFFIVAFDAAPGVTYMNQLAEAYRAGLSVKRIVEIFTSKKQFTDVYPLTLNHQSLAEKLTQNIVKSSATEATKASAMVDIKAALDGGWSRADVVYQVFGNLARKSEDDPDWGSTSIFFRNEIAVAKAYTEVMNQSTTDLPTLRKVLSATSATSDLSYENAAIELALMGMVSSA